jgi:geranylgeranyl diphosphate synthase, type I
MSLKEITTQMLPAIEKELQQAVACVKVPRIEEYHLMLAYHMGWEGEHAGPVATGKRIRPLLVLLATGAAQGDWEKALPAAAAVELIHNFSLIHDDIQDGSDQRRGRPTVWKLWGTAQAINSGDAMFSLAHLTILRLSNTTNEHIAFQAARLLQETCLELTKGQYLDMSYESRTRLTIDDYWPMVSGKTAALLSTCTELGALVAGANPDTRSLYSKFGRSLGLAFQVQDDLLGIWGDAALTGKSTQSDLLTGKKSLPVLYGMSQNGKFARRWAEGPIQQEEVQHLARILEEEGAYSFTQRTSEELTEQALQALSEAKPAGEYASALIELANKLVNRRG